MVALEGGLGGIGAFGEGRPGARGRAKLTISINIGKMGKDNPKQPGCSHTQEANPTADAPFLSLISGSQIN